MVLIVMDDSLSIPSANDSVLYENYVDSVECAEYACPSGIFCFRFIFITFWNKFTLYFTLFPGLLSCILLQVVVSHHLSPINRHRRRGKGRNRGRVRGTHRRRPVLVHHHLLHRPLLPLLFLLQVNSFILYFISLNVAILQTNISVKRRRKKKVSSKKGTRRKRIHRETKSKRRKVKSKPKTPSKAPVRAPSKAPVRKLVDFQEPNVSGVLIAVLSFLAIVH